MEATTSSLSYPSAIENTVVVSINLVHNCIALVLAVAAIAQWLSCKSSKCAIYNLGFESPRNLGFEILRNLGFEFPRNLGFGFPRNLGFEFPPNLGFSSRISP